MGLYKTTLVAMLVSVCIEPAHGQQLANRAKRIVPLRIAPAELHGEEVIRTGPWRGLPENSDCPGQLVFDLYNPNTADGTPIGGDACGLTTPETRWFLGEECSTEVVNDYEVAAGAEGQPLTRFHHAWQWTVDGLGTSEQCTIGVFFSDSFDDTCTGPASGLGSGMLLDYGVLVSTTGTADYYFGDVCLVGVLDMDLPVDGTGAYIMKYWQDDGSSALKQATCAQSMLWGLDTPGYPIEGHHTATQWDDISDVLIGSGSCTPPDCSDDNGDSVCDNTPDGTLAAPCECRDHSWGLCPDPLGAMLALYSPQLSVTCPSPGMKNQINDIVIHGATPGSTIKVAYGTANGTTAVPSCGTVDIDSAQLLLSGLANSVGTVYTTKFIPISAPTLIKLQAVEVGSCQRSAVASCILYDPPL